ncbi:MAG TPA: Hsp20/alpha crystallin family protein [Catalimonadaceae bacterium]|nr:Hsp20/alpha crystallin family protein [Catalimonadaceae bacterium]
MSLIRFNSSALPSLVETFFNREALDSLHPFQNQFLPSVNIFEKEDGYEIDVAAPGLKKENFQINLNQSNLSIAYSEEEKKEESNGKFTRREFRTGSFKRNFTVPQTIDNERINASYTDGILKIFLPKREEAKVKPERLIEIQ